MKKCQLQLKSKRKRLDEEEDEFYNIFVKRDTRFNENSQHRKAAITAPVENVKKRKDCAPDKQREIEKPWWLEVYQNYSDENFKSEMSLNRDTFNYIFNYLTIHLTPLLSISLHYFVLFFPDITLISIPSLCKNIPMLS